MPTYSRSMGGEYDTVRNSDQYKVQAPLRPSLHSVNHYRGHRHCRLFNRAVKAQGGTGRQVGLDEYQPSTRPNTVVRTTPSRSDHRKAQLRFLCSLSLPFCDYIIRRPPSRLETIRTAGSPRNSKKNHRGRVKLSLNIVKRNRRI